MKSTFTFFKLVSIAAFFFVSFSSIAQKGKISGTVFDSLSQKPVEFANVALVKRESNTPVNGAVCDDKGAFMITKVAPGNYNVLITFIGFKTKAVSVTVDDKKDEVSVGKVIISPTQQVLKEVTVEGEKALIEERVDRTVYNAENDATAKGGDATDVLKRVPLLSVDLDGNVTLRGSQNILVLINNKPSSIMAGSIADALKQIPADQIKSVEVITSPSAKYDAEGSSGIINIITKKNTLEGLTLNVDTGVGLRGSNLGLNGNYRKGKMGFSLGGFGRANYNVRGNFRNEQLTNRLDANTSETISILNVQQADTRNAGMFGNYNLGWDYDIDKKNSLAASVSFGLRNGKTFQDDLTTELYNNGILQSTSIADNTSKDRSNNVDANFTYTHYYEKPQRELSFQGLFSRDNRDNDFENDYKQSTDNSVVNRLNKNDSYNQEITLQADYQTPINTNQMLEFGGKTIMRKVLSDYQTFLATGVDGAYVLSANTTNTNNLNYDQNVSAAYLSYTISSKSGYSLKAGSRYEYTTISAYTKTENDIRIPSYGVLVPSVNLSRKLKNGNTVKASYNRRIQRPSIRFLNPNIQQSGGGMGGGNQGGNLNITQGNPTLEPEYTNNYELSYNTLIKSVMLNISTFVRNTNNAIQSLRDTITLDGEIRNRTTYENIGVENAYGTSLFLGVNVGRLSLNGGGDFFYSVLDNKVPNEELRAKNEGWVFSGRAFGNYRLNKGWGLQLFSFYRGNTVLLQGNRGGFYFYSLAVRKEFNEKRGSVGLGIENFLQSSIKVKSETIAPTITQRSVNEFNNLSFRVNFSYRIGKMSLNNAPPRRRKTISNDDLKDGGGGDMQMGAGDGGGQQRGQGGGQMQRPPQGGNQKPPQQTKSTPSAPDTVIYEAAGKWNFNIESPQGGNGTLSIINQNGVYSGTIKTNRMQQETALTNIVVKGNAVSFSYNVNFGGNSATVTYEYRLINKNEITGTMSFGQFGSFPIKGTRAE